MTKNDLKFTRAEINLLLQNLDHLSDYEVQSLNASLEELDRQEYVESCQNDLIAFAKHMQDDYMVGKHHRILADRLMAVERGEKDRVCVNLPPRHGKSALTSLLYPAWFIGKNPKKSIIMVSHTADLAVDFGRKVRNLIASEAYAKIFPDVALASDSKSSGRWNTNHGGEFFACGVGSALAGRGADLLLIDDPHSEQDLLAGNFAALDTAYAWFAYGARTRLMKGGRIAVVHCMVGETPVTMADGTYKRLDEIRPGDMVKAWKDGALVDRKVLNWTSQGEDDVFEIKTGNATVRANAKHPFLIERRNGERDWVQVKDIMQRPIYDRKMVMSARMDFGKPATLSIEEAWLLGYMFGDGWITRRNTTQINTANGKRYPRRGYVTCVALSAKPDENAKVASAFQSLFGVTPKVTKFGYSRTEVQRVGRWFADHGLTGKAKTKRLPGWLFSEPLGVRLAFLAGYNCADGSELPCGSWQFGASNVELVRDVRHLGRSCGFRPTNISVETFTAQPPNSPQPVAGMTARMRWTKDRTDEPFMVRAGVSSVTPVGRAEVFDIEVEDAECFLADGLVSHNTRWHQDDLTGRLTRAMAKDPDADQYEVVEFPAILELQGEDGETVEKALWPEYFPLRDLKRTKASMPLFQWNAQYQQNPTSEEAAVIKREWWQRWTKDQFPSCEGVIMSLDAAAETHNRADFTALTTWGVFVNEETGAYNLILLSSIKKRVDFPDLKQLCIQEYREWQPDSFIVEKKSAGVAIYQELRRMGIPVTEYTPHRGSGDKMARLNSVADIIASGLVWVTDHPWAEELVEEVAAFPFASHDDLVDSMVYALMRFRQGGLIRLGTDYEEEYVPRKRQTAYY